MGKDDHLHIRLGGGRHLDHRAVHRPPGSSGGGSGGHVAIETIAYSDAFGVPTSITDFNGNTTTFSLDSHGNVLQEMQPGGVNQEWTYNSAGQVLTVYRRNGARRPTLTTLGPVDFDRRARHGHADDPYGYDAAGDETSVTDEAATPSRTPTTKRAGS